ncbi:sensor histidine kinase [Isoptericola variabilis]|nr:histidine kinase [Isoptericola variabilis]
MSQPIAHDAGLTDVGRAPGDRAPGRSWTSRGGTVVAVTVSAFSALTAAAWADMPGDASTSLAILAALIGLILAGLLVLRRRYPVQLNLAASAAPLLLPLDSSAALLTLPWVYATSTSRRTVAGCTAATAAGTAAALVRDALRAPEHRVFAVFDESGALTSAPGTLSFVFWGLFFLGASVAAGLVRRSRATADRARVAEASAEAAREAQVAQTAVLRDRMTRQEERELIAREVHDTVAHHIATISLQASALEVARGEDPEAREAAREVRASAQRAIAEMRTLLSTLRDGDGTLLPGTSLEDLVPLLERLRDGGAGITSSIFVSDGHTAAPALTRATFRIVQESVTNALKHAPGSPVDVTVRAARATGVDVRVTNRLTDEPAPAAPGTGAGITGMRERVQALGGTLDVHVDDGRHVVAAHLPWVDAEHPEADTASVR